MKNEILDNNNIMMYDEKTYNSSFRLVFKVKNLSTGNNLYIEGYLEKEYTNNLKKEFIKLKSKNKTINIFFNSPGGEAQGIKSFADEIYSSSLEGFVVNGFIDGLCCSGAYFLASSCSNLYATEDSLIGSIGVYSRQVNFDEMNKKWGILTKIFRSKNAKNKNLDPVTNAEGEKDLQGILDGLEEQFLHSVARGRNLGLEKVKEISEGGKVFLAAKALEKGFINKIQNNFIEILENGERGNIMTKEQEEKLFSQLESLEISLSDLNKRFLETKNENSSLKESIEKFKFEQNNFNESLIKKLESAKDEDIKKAESFFC